MVPVTPERIQKGCFAFAETRLLVTAVESGVFEHIAAGKTTARTIARAAHCDPRGTRILLDGLVGLGYLRKRGAGYALALDVRRFLLKEAGNQYLGGMVAHAGDLMESWAGLTTCVRQGRARRRHRSEKETAQFFGTLVHHLFYRNYPQASQLCAALGVGTKRRGLQILDVAAGSAAWSLPFAQADPETRVTAVDFKPVLDIAMEFAVSLDVGDQYSFLAGNIRQLHFGRNRYDLAILGHICHSEGPKHTQRLFRKVSAALRPGGQMLIADMIADEGRRGAGGRVFPLLFAVNMLVNTDEGDTFTRSEYRKWLTQAGFGRMRLIKVGSHSPIICVRKKSQRRGGAS